MFTLLNNVILLYFQVTLIVIGCLYDGGSATREARGQQFIHVYILAALSGKCLMTCLSGECSNQLADPCGLMGVLPFLLNCL